MVYYIDETGSVRSHHDGRKNFFFEVYIPEAVFLWLLRLWTLPFFGVIIEPGRKEWPMPRGLGVFNVGRD
jgi:hypothetical protein